MKQQLYAHLKQRKVLISLLLLILDGIFFSSTNPNRVPSSLLIVGFILVALSVYGLIRLILVAATLYGLPLHERGRRPALFLGIGAAIVIALQSLGELTLRDVVVLSLLSFIAYLYTSYGQSSRR